jgi:hypothetical protein
VLAFDALSVDDRAENIEGGARARVSTLLFTRRRMELRAPRCGSTRHPSKSAHLRSRTPKS